MGTTLALVVKDIRRAIASPAGILMSLAIPLAISGTMALAFGGFGDDDAPAVPKLELVMVDLDKGHLSDWLMGAGQNDQVAERIVTVRAESLEGALELMRDSGHHAILVIPEGFSEDILDGREVELQLIKNPARSVMPIAAQQGMEVLGLYASVGTRILPEGAAARIQELFEGEGWDDSVGIAAMIADTYIRVKRSESLLFPPVVKVAKTDDNELSEDDDDEDSGGGFNLFSWMYPGMMVMSLLFVGLNQMKSLVTEQDEGTMRRLLSGPVSPAQFLISKVISSAVAVAGALLIMVGIGSAAFGLSWGRLLPFTVTSLAMIFAVTGFSALLYSLARTQNEGDALGGILVIVMALMGGTMFPTQVLPDFLRSAARFTFNYWGNESFRALASGGGWPELGSYLPVLAAMAVIFTTTGTLLLRQRQLRGAV